MDLNTLAQFLRSHGGKSARSSMFWNRSLWSNLSLFHFAKESLAFKACYIIYRMSWACRSGQVVSLWTLIPWNRWWKIITKQQQQQEIDNNDISDIEITITKRWQKSRLWKHKALDSFKHYEWQIKNYEYKEEGNFLGEDFHNQHRWALARSKLSWQRFCQLVSKTLNYKL